MKSLREFLQIVFEEEAGGEAGGSIFQTPTNTIGMDDIGFETDPLISAPEGGIPKEKTKITKKRRKKKKMKDLRDFIMTGEYHNT